MSVDLKLEKISEDIGEIKVTIAKQEIILGGLAKSVDHHIKRTDVLQELVTSVKNDHDLFKNQSALQNQINQERTSYKTKYIWTVLKTILATLSAAGATLLALHELGILQNLIK
jgi:hypothetical protein